MKFQKLDRVRVNQYFLDSFLDEGGTDDGSLSKYIGKEGYVSNTYRYIAVHFDDGDEGFFTELELDFISRPEV